MSAWGRLHAATLELAKGSAIKQRLTACFSKHLKDLDVADLPSSLRPEFLAILRGFEAVTPLPGETPIHATVRKMSGEDAERLAARVVELFGEVARSAAPTLALAKEPNDRRSERFGDESDNVIPLLYASEA
jgi:hypothetical protein